jgi:hypothetical protein
MTAQKWSCEVGKYLRGYSKNKYSAPERNHQTFTRTSQYRKFPGRGFHKYLKQGQSLSRIWRDAALRVDKTAIGRQADFALARQARTILGDIRRASAWTSSRSRQERLGFGPNAAYEIGRWLGSGERGALSRPSRHR